MEHADLLHIVQQTLRSRAIDNRGRLHPALLNQLGEELLDVLLASPSSSVAEQARMFEERGLALSSVLAAGTALQRALYTANDGERAINVAERLAQLAVDIKNDHLEAVRREQESIRAAVMRVLEEQRGEIERGRVEADRLASLVHELSIPIVPIYTGILVLPLIGAIDSRRSSEMTDRLLTSISHYQADCVIIDITGVAVVDTGVAQHLLQTARAASLLGALVIFTGIGPEIAQTMVQLGIELNGVVTLRDLEAALTFALRRRKLAIQPVRG